MACFSDSGKACQFVSLGDFLDASGKVGRVEVVRCSECGHAVSLPSLPDVGFLYETRESQDFQPATRGLSRMIKDFAFRFQARKLLRQIGKIEGDILDFGCGSGQFTRVLEEMADGEVFGADMHSDAPSELRGKHYLSATALNRRKGAFNVVMAMHVIEHDENPDGLLSRIADYVRPGGKVVVEVPNVDCVWTGAFGKYWDAWYLPYHRQHFTRDSLASLMQRNGLKVESVYGITVPTMGRTFANIFGSSNNLFWLLVGIVAHPIQLAGEKLTGRCSATRVIATKAG